MKIPKYVIAPDGCASYLTPGKKYCVSDWREDKGTYHMARFRIWSDDGQGECCVLVDCHNLNGGNWIIPENEA